MRRYGYIVLSVAAAAWVIVAVVLGSGSPTRASGPLPPSGPSPACLPASQQHSARLAGTNASVSPAPQTDTANPASQVSFLGEPVTQIRDVAVEGSRSGYHWGHLYGYFQGDGGSFVPDKPFASDERVAVRALLGPPGAEHRVAFSFHTATLYPSAQIKGFPNPPVAPTAVQNFVSAPGLKAPILSVTSADRDPGAGDIFMTTGPGPGQYGPLIYTPQGRLVWFGALPTGVSALGVSVQSYEGQNDLTWWQGRVLAQGFGEGEDIVMNANYQNVATVRAGNGYNADLHEFRLGPDNTAYITVYSLDRCDLSPAGGVRNGVILDPAIQQVDIKTGLVRWEWHSLDHVAVAESHAPVPTTAIPWDWFHLNSIDVQGDGSLVISARSTWTAYKLQPASGEILWRLGGTKSSFRMAPGAAIAWQHDARVQPDGTITMFDDGSAPRVHYQSRGVRLALDTKAGTATLLRAYPHPGAPLLSDSQGSMQTLPDQGEVIGWGAVPSVTEVSASGETLLDAHLPPGFSSYRAFRYPWSGQPLWLPGVNAQLTASLDSTAVFASWNGATGVASWRVLAGSAPGSLTPAGSMPASGFESSVILPEPYSYVAVQALDAAGRVLSTSSTVAVQHPVAAGSGG
jgi:hypothetical protein